MIGQCRLLAVVNLCTQFWKHENHIFSLKCCVTAFPADFSQWLLGFFNLVHLQLIRCCVTP